VVRIVVWLGLVDIFELVRSMQRVGVLGLTDCGFCKVRVGVVSAGRAVGKFGTGWRNRKQEGVVRVHGLG